MNDDSIQIEFERKQKEKQDYYLQLALNSKLKLSHLQDMPLIHSGHYENVKYDNGKYRILLSRMTIKDGQPYNNQIIVEKYEDFQKEWIIINKFQAK